jgi:SAM-dependent methyltransferase
MQDSDADAKAPLGFTREQREEAYPRGIGAHAWFQGRNRILYGKLPEPARRGVVLDVGCGPGITVAHLRGKKIDCHGCDLATYEPEDPRQAGYLHYGTDALALPADFRSRVGTLLMLDVLEHLEDPKALLCDCIEAFPALEYLLITLPARMELWSDYDERYGHVARFDHRSVLDLCAVSGLEMISSGYFFHSLYGVLRAMGRGVAGREMHPPRLPFLHALIGGLLHLEEKLLPSRLPGSSLYALLRVTR